jgi:hypothetical protein
MTSVIIAIVLHIVKYYFNKACSQATIGFGAHSLASSGISDVRLHVRDNDQAAFPDFNGRD